MPRQSVALTRADRGLIARTKLEWHAGVLTADEALYWLTHYLGDDKATHVMKGLLHPRKRRTTGTTGATGEGS